MIQSKTDNQEYVTNKLSFLSQNCNGSWSTLLFFKIVKYTLKGVFYSPPLKVLNCTLINQIGPHINNCRMVIIIFF